jgi:predicted nucleic acid-binding protein
MNHKELIVDAGFFVAIFSKTDQHHKKALSLKNRIDKKKWITTWPVLTEASHLLANRGFYHVIENLLQMHKKGGYAIFSLTDDHLPRMIELFNLYAQLPIDLADASLVVLAEELGHGDIVTTDCRDFRAYRWKNHKPFNNLLKL